MKNIITFLSAIMLSSVFWLIHTSSQQNIKTIENPASIQFFNIPEGLAISSPAPKIEIKVDASKEVLRQIQEKDFSAFINFSEATEGVSSFPIEVQSQNPLIRIVSFSPNVTEIEIEAIRTKTIPIELVIKGEPFEGFKIKNTTLSQKNTTIKTGKTALKNIQSIIAELSLENEKESFKRNISLQVLDSNNEIRNNIPLEPKSIEVQIELTQIESTKQLGIHVPIINILPDNFFIESINISPNSTEIKGKKEVLEAIQTLETESIDLSKITKSKIFTKKIIPALNTEITGEKTVKIDIKIGEILPQKPSDS